MNEKYERRKKCLRNRLRHNLHPYTIYCRMIDAGFNEATSVRRVCTLYEQYIWVWLKEVIQKLPERRC